MPRRFIKLGCGKDPGPLGEGKWRPEDAEPIPGDGARRGGVARPNPESESKYYTTSNHALVKITITKSQLKGGESQAIY